MEAWKPTTFEDTLLYEYWKMREKHLYLEVPVGNKELGNWPPKSKIRRIDGVIILDELKKEEPNVFRYRDYTIEEFYKKVQGKTIELIEVKKNLNRLVIGQVIAGADMFERQYNTSKIIPVILCKNGDPALEWVCKKRNIKVEII